MEPTSLAKIIISIVKVSTLKQQNKQNEMLQLEQEAISKEAGLTPGLST